MTISDDGPVDSICRRWLTSRETLLIAVALVILVIFCFWFGLRHLHSGVAGPISLFGTCAVMYARSISINNMTLWH